MMGKMMGASAGPRPRSWKKTFLYAGPALAVAGLAIWGQSVYRAPLQAVTGAALGWSMEAHGSNTTSAKLKQSLVKRSKELGLPAQIALVAQSGRYLERAEKALARRTGSQPSGDVTQLADETAEATLKGLKGWVSGRWLATTTLVPALILYLGCQVEALNPLYFIIGAVSAGFAAPLLARIDTLVRRMAASESVRDKGVMTQSEAEQRFADAGNLAFEQPGPYHSGRDSDTMSQLSATEALRAAIASGDEEQLALAVLLINRYPEITALDPAFARSQGLRLLERFPGTEVRARVEDLIKRRARKEGLSAGALDGLLGKFRALMDAGDPDESFWGPPVTA